MEAATTFTSLRDSLENVKLFWGHWASEELHLHPFQTTCLSISTPGPSPLFPFVAAIINSCSNDAHLSLLFIELYWHLPTHSHVRTWLKLPHLISVCDYQGDLSFLTCFPAFYGTGVLIHPHLLTQLQVNLHICIFYRHTWIWR